jgi:hypothetical protein
MDFYLTACPSPFPCIEITWMRSISKTFQRSFSFADIGGSLLLLCSCLNVFASCEQGWTKFWWWNAGTNWPATVRDVLENEYGACETSDYCFQRLPAWTRENKTELLAVDSLGTIYQWKFDPANPTAHAVWLALHDHQETAAAKVM